MTSDDMFAALRRYLKGKLKSNRVLTFEQWKALDKETKWRVAKVYELASDLRLAHLPKEIGGTAVLLKNLIVRTAIEMEGAACYYSEDNLAAAYQRYYKTIRHALKALRDAAVVERFSLGDGIGYAYYPIITQDMLDNKGMPPSDFIKAATGVVHEPGSSNDRGRARSQPGSSTVQNPGRARSGTRGVHAPQDSKSKTPRKDSKIESAKGDARKRASPRSSSEIFGEVPEPTQTFLREVLRFHPYRGGEDPKGFARLLHQEIRHYPVDTLSQALRIIATEKKFFPTISEIVEACDEAEYRLDPLAASGLRHPQPAT